MSSLVKVLDCFIPHTFKRVRSKYDDYIGIKLSCLWSENAKWKRVHARYFNLF